MAKDPAINWYFDNWNGGTRLMSRHQKGCYMDLLDAQFHSGPLSLEDIKAVLGSDFQAAWPNLSKKFTHENGRYFNERLEAEKQKRAAYSESRSRNRKKIHMNNISKSYDEDVKITPETETGINTDLGEKGGTGGKRGILVTDLMIKQFHEHHRKLILLYSNQYKLTEARVWELVLSFLEEKKAQEFEYEDFNKLKSHLSAWIRKNPEKNPEKNLVESAGPVKKMFVPPEYIRDGKAN